MTDKPDGKRWSFVRGLAGAMTLSLACQVAATYWIVSSLSGNTARIQWPYNELWYALAVNLPAAIFWLWYFARPSRRA
jgi:hypothetical protein